MAEARPALPRRSAGVVLHATSLPGGGPVGGMGRAARRWVDFLSAAGFGWWQVCPLGPTGYGDSPYQPLSVFALNPHLIDLEDLERQGLVTPDERREVGSREGACDHGLAWERLRPLLAQAAARGAADPARLARWGDLAEHRERERAWLGGWERFAALREANGFAAPARWTSSADDGDARARAAVLQLVAETQWRELRAHAARRGVRILGDEPIYVSADGADRWGNPGLFAKGEVAGVPPDYFSADGQLWGNPLYDWPRHAADGFAWWRARVGRDLGLFDAVRLDHFRGICDYWSVPEGATSAKEGAWREGPGMAFFRALGPCPMVAEDLGLLSAGVHALRAAAGLPGMAVLQFGFPRSEDNPHHPDAITPDRLAYTGTHDNDTTAGWFAGLDKATAAEARAAIGEGPVARAAWRTVLASPAIGAFAPAQDLLGLGSEARLNTPGTATGNWTWRLTEAQLAELEGAAAELRREIAGAGRTSN